MSKSTDLKKQIVSTEFEVQDLSKQSRAAKNLMNVSLLLVLFWALLCMVGSSDGANELSEIVAAFVCIFIIPLTLILAVIGFVRVRKLGKQLSDAENRYKMAKLELIELEN
jgi:ABC-type polysaccharide/polyol phosphate export permease